MNDSIEKKNHELKFISNYLVIRPLNFLHFQSLRISLTLIYFTSLFHLIFQVTYVNLNKLLNLLFVSPFHIRTVDQIIRSLFNGSLTQQTFSAFELFIVFLGIRVSSKVRHLNQQSVNLRLKMYRMPSALLFV